MTPGARLAAAISVLETVLNQRRPADAALVDWARQNRFAGSADRRALAARVFTVLRRRNECAHLMGGHGEPRALVLGSLKLEGLACGQIEAIASDGPHAPGPLSLGETTLLREPTLPAHAPWTRLNYPEWLHPELQRSLGSALERELEAMLARAPLDLRVNRLKASREEAQRALEREGVHSDPSSFSKYALRAREAAKLEHLSTFQNGWIEVQDTASQAVCDMLQVLPGERVVDLCAGAGGKALALAAAMGNRGTILACDVDGKRLGRLAPRAVRAGVTIVELTGDPYTEHSQLGPELADAVIVDAPCSGSGTWRRNPESKWTLDAERLAGYVSAQANALDRAFELTRPGGRVLYVTCSLLWSEGESQVDAALKRAPAWRLDTLRRFSPATSDTDGFFAAVLTKAY